MPFKSREKRKAWDRVYSQERGVGLRRRGAVAEVVARMESRLEADRERVRAWCAANRERRNLQQRERRRAVRRAAEGAALLRAAHGEGIGDPLFITGDERCKQQGGGELQQQQQTD